MAPLLFACGSNGSGQIAISHTNDVHNFTRCTFHPSLDSVLQEAKIVDLVSASTHSLLLLNYPDTSDQGINILLGAGTNTLGQLGIRCALWDEVKPETAFKPVDLLGPLGLSHLDWEPVKIASTWTTSFVVYKRIKHIDEMSSSSRVELDVDGEEVEVDYMVIASGSNDFGELGILPGNSGEVDRSRPVMVDLELEKGNEVETIKGGQRHCLAVISRGSGTGRVQRLVGWGASRKGELDLDTVQWGASSIGSSKDGAKGKGKAAARPTAMAPTELAINLPDDSHIIDLALGASHSLALLSNGEVSAWGNDSKGQINALHPPAVRQVKGIAATWFGTYILKEDGHLWSQGSNNHYQLLRSHGYENELGQVPVVNGQIVEKLAAGSEHVIVSTTTESEQEIRVGGWNEHGNLGLSDQMDRDLLSLVDIESLVRDAGKEGKVLVRGIWGGCAATWVWLDAAPP